MTDSAIRDFNAWIVYCDIFGFSAYVRDDVTKVTNALYKGHTTLYDRFVSRNPEVHIKLISDSIFLIFEVVTDKEKPSILQTCVEDVQWLMSKFVDLRLPLRGGISYGKIYFGDDLLLGDAVVRAVRHEAMIPAPFVLLPVNEMDGLSRSEFPNGITKVPVKGDGLIKCALIRPNPIDGLLELAKELSDKYCTSGPYPQGKVWSDALDYIQGGKD